MKFIQKYVWKPRFIIRHKSNARNDEIKRKKPHFFLGNIEKEG